MSKYIKPRIKFKRHELKCRFCPTITGKIFLPEDKLLENEVTDVRCDIHKVEHGEYKELVEKIIKADKNADVEKILKGAEYKKDKVDVEIEKNRLWVQVRETAYEYTGVSDKQETQIE